MTYIHRRRKPGGDGEGTVSPPKFQVGGIIPPPLRISVLKIFFAIKNIRRYGVVIPRVPLPSTLLGMMSKNIVHGKKWVGV